MTLVIGVGSALQERAVANTLELVSINVLQCGPGATAALVRCCEDRRWPCAITVVIRGLNAEEALAELRLITSGFENLRIVAFGPQGPFGNLPSLLSSYAEPLSGVVLSGGKCAVAPFKVEVPVDLRMSFALSCFMHDRVTGSLLNMAKVLKSSKITRNELMIAAANLGEAMEELETISRHPKGYALAQIVEALRRKIQSLCGAIERLDRNAALQFVTEAQQRASSFRAECASERMKLREMCKE